MYCKILKAKDCESLDFSVCYADSTFIKNLDTKRTLKVKNRVSGSRDLVVFHLNRQMLSDVDFIVTRDRYNQETEHYRVIEEIDDEHNYYSRYVPFPLFIVFKSVSALSKYKLKC